MKIINCIQGSEEWLRARLGKLTASDAQAIGNNGKGLDTLCLEKAAELLTGQLPPQLEDNEDIQRGKELEAEARAAYQLETGNSVYEVGFIELNEYVGCSPDGLIGEDGDLEIKCKNNKNHLLMLLGKPIDSKYDWQIQMRLLITGRKWCDFVSYNPNFADNPLIILRVYPNAEKQAALQEGIKNGVEKIKQIISEVKYGKSNKKI